MEIKDHKLVGVEYKQTPNISGAPLNLDSIIIHYTAGGSASSAIRAMVQKGNASAHLVVDREGTITQLAAFNQIAWHAGVSAYGGRSGFNNYSVGIEIVNAGWLKKEGNVCKTYYGEVVAPEDVFEGAHRNPETKSKYWQKYTQKQIDAVTQICEAICANYDVQYILGHEEISPGRKQDPGPAFPLDEMRNKIFGKKSAADDFGKATVKLNIRTAPQKDAKSIAQPLEKDTKVKVIQTSGEWIKVVAPIVGWVSGEFLEHDNTDSEWDAHVEADSLNIREKPGGEMIAKALVKGTKVRILEQDEEWNKVEATVIGWVMKEFVAMEA